HFVRDQRVLLIAQPDRRLNLRRAGGDFFFRRAQAFRGLWAFGRRGRGFRWSGRGSRRGARDRRRRGRDGRRRGGPARGRRGIGDRGRRDGRLLRPRRLLADVEDLRLAVLANHLEGDPVPAPAAGGRCLVRRRRRTGR